MVFGPGELPDAVEDWASGQQATTHLAMAGLEELRWLRVLARLEPGDACPALPGRATWPATRFSAGLLRVQVRPASAGAEAPEPELERTADVDHHAELAAARDACG